MNLQAGLAAGQAFSFVREGFTAHDAGVHLWSFGGGHPPPVEILHNRLSGAPELVCNLLDVAAVCEHPDGRFVEFVHPFLLSL